MIARLCIGLLATGVVVVEIIGEREVTRSKRVIPNTSKHQNIRHLPNLNHFHKGPIRSHIEKLAKEMDTDSQGTYINLIFCYFILMAMTLDGQFQRSYSIPHPP